MRLADYTDYTLRVQMYCASNPGRLVTIAEIAERHGVSRNHLMKIVSDLGRQGLLATTRGRGGGVQLMKPPQDIGIGEVLRFAETDFRLVECFDEGTSNCAISPTCRLKRLLDDALNAYFRVLDGATLADLVLPPSEAARTGLGVHLRAPPAEMPEPARRRPAARA